MKYPYQCNLHLLGQQPDMNVRWNKAPLVATSDAIAVLVAANDSTNPHKQLELLKAANLDTEESDFKMKIFQIFDGDYMAVPSFLCQE